MRFAEAVGRRPPRRRTTAEAPSRQYNGDIDRRAVELRFVHVRYRTLGICWSGIQHIRDSAVRQELPVDRHLQVLDVAIAAENLAQVRLVDVLCEFFYNDFGAARLAVRAGWARGSRARVAT